MTPRGGHLHYRIELHSVVPLTDVTFVGMPMQLTTYCWYKMTMCITPGLTSILIHFLSAEYQHLGEEIQYAKLISNMLVCIACMVKFKPFLLMSAMMKLVKGFL